MAYPAQCDAMGHMNVQYYVSAFDQAMWGLVYALGWRRGEGPSVTGFADVRHDIRYRSELAAGVPFRVYSMPVKAGHSSFVSLHHMFNVETGALAAEMEMTSVHFDLVNRVAIPVPVVLKDAANIPWSMPSV